MAARKPAAKAAEVDGVKVVIDTAYQSSWDGVMQAAYMQKRSEDETADNGTKFLAVLEYYNRVVSNMDEVKEALGGNPPAEKMLNLIQKALADADSKN